MNEDGPPRIALTFDAEHPDRELCPPDAATRILDALSKADVRATFFVQSRWATAYPDLARRIASEGHVVGHHSKYHARLPLLSDDGIRVDVLEGEEEIRDVTGVDPKPWFRLPFGEGFDDPRVTSALSGLGYKNVHWDYSVDDWAARSEADVRTRVLSRAASAGPSETVMLFHTWPGPTAEALPSLLQELRERGVQFIRVAELGALP